PSDLGVAQARTLASARTARMPPLSGPTASFAVASIGPDGASNTNRERLGSSGSAMNLTGCRSAICNSVGVAIPSLSRTRSSADQRGIVELSTNRRRHEPAPGDGALALAGGPEQPAGPEPADACAV